MMEQAITRIMEADPELKSLNAESASPQHKLCALPITTQPGNAMRMAGLVRWRWESLRIL